MSSSKTTGTSSKHSRGECGEDYRYVSNPSAKRSRGGDDDHSASTSGPSLNEDALSCVLEFLPPRELFNTAFTCKGLRDEITTKVVVRSALIHGGHAKQTCEELHNLMSNKAMHVPSPLRLLRLINGKRCEFCVANKVNHVRPCIGVFACWDCVTQRGLTKAWNTSWVRHRRNQARYDAILNHPRVATNTYGDKEYMWLHRYNVTGEKIGPVVTFGDVDRMFDHVREGGGVDDYIEEVLGAPSAEEYCEFNDTYAESIERAKRAMEEREEKKRKASQRTKDNKRAKIDKMISDLEALLDEPFRDAALDRRNVEYRYGVKTSKLPCIRFSVPFVDSLMEQYIITPSKIRKKILKEIAGNINAKLRLIGEKNFLSFDFLSEKDPFEAALKHHFSEELTSLDALLKTKIVSYYGRFNQDRREKALINDKFFSLLENNRLLAALAHLKENDLSSFLLPDDDAVQTNNLLEKLAKNVWFSKLKEEDANDDRSFGKAFAASQAPFGDARLAIEAYTTWLQENYTEERNDDRRRFARRDAFQSPSALPFLLSRNFEGLDKHQACAYNSWFEDRWR
mmetsp:Transcript_17989/g.39328  ORF Transcript_17989/g.39328 Transcript_17989/m.39328 type:complete len:568 (-) Transcript_17989:678-2381(-)